MYGPAAEDAGDAGDRGRAGGRAPFCKLGWAGQGGAGAVGVCFNTGGLGMAWHGIGADKGGKGHPRHSYCQKDACDKEHVRPEMLLLSEQPPPPPPPAYQPLIREIFGHHRLRS